jgi:hypothetical protein
MKIHYKYFFLLLPLLSATTIDHNNICGTYVVNNSEWYGQTLVIKDNGLFIETTGGCVYDIQTTGQWKTQKDTLTLEINKRKDLRTKREFKVENKTDKYLIKTDTLFRINSENTNKAFDADFALIRQKKK